MSEEDLVTRAAQHITQGDFMGAMALFDSHVEANPDDPAGYHGWAESALFEIQQKSDLTYRVYDYNRRGPDGKLRELHLAKALDVIRYEPPAQEKIPPLNLGPGRDLLVACPFFALERHRYDAPVQLSTRPTSFETWTVIDGAATVAGEKLALGQSLVLPAAVGDYTIEPAGNVTLLRTIYPDLQTDFIAPLRQLGYSEDRIFQTVKMPDYG